MNPLLLVVKFHIFISSAPPKITPSEVCIKFFHKNQYSSIIVNLLYYVHVVSISHNTQINNLKGMITKMVIFVSGNKIHIIQMDTEIKYQKYDTFFRYLQKNIDTNVPN